MAEELFVDVDIEDIIHQNQSDDAMIDSYLDEGYPLVGTASESSMIDNLFSSMDKGI